MWKNMFRVQKKKNSPDSPSTWHRHPGILSDGFQEDAEILREAELIPGSRVTCRGGLVGWLEFTWVYPWHKHVFLNHPQMGMVYGIGFPTWSEAAHEKHRTTWRCGSTWQQTSNPHVAMLKISKRPCTTPSQPSHMPRPGWKRAQCFKPNLSPASMVMMGSPEGTRGIPRLKLWMDSTWSGSRTKFLISSSKIFWTPLKGGKQPLT